METNKIVKEYLGTGKIAKLFGVAPRTVAKWIDNGIMLGIKIPGSRHRRVHIAEVNKFSNTHNIPFIDNEKIIEELTGLDVDDFLGRKDV